MDKFFWMIIGLLATSQIFGQQKIEAYKRDQQPVVAQDHGLIAGAAEMIVDRLTRAHRHHSTFNSTKPQRALSSEILTRAFINNGLQLLTDPTTHEIIAVKGTINKVTKLKTHKARIHGHLDEIKDIWKLAEDTDELRILKTYNHKQEAHSYVDQYHQGIKVHGGELTIHERQGAIYMVQGHVKTITEEIDLAAGMTQAAMQEYFTNKVVSHKPFNSVVAALMSHDQIEMDQLIYEHEGRHLIVWQIDYYHNLVDRETFIINAETGDVIDRYETICRIHDHSAPFAGKAVGSGTALNGSTERLEIYDCDDGYYLVDASRSMFRGREVSCDLTDQLLNGVIMTLDAGGTSPSNANFNYDVANSTNANSWQDPVAVSAHVNGARAYEYFKNAFGRESITGRGTNIISFVNVGEADGSRMDNAFWNGEYIFYGNGLQAFNRPLAQALDVAGHEMSHGVIQSTANLEYRNESGALNEHFADVFGVLIENEDFRIGEDVVSPSVFPSGTLRDMGNPNNGGTRLGDTGWQPANVNQQFLGREDNGGVHINSGIPNAAFFHFVTNESFGADIDARARIAEQVWYRALTTYLRSTSNFADMRVAIIQSAQDLQGTAIAEAAAAAFDAVGITGAGVSAPVQDLEENPGDEYVIYADVNLHQLNLLTGEGADFGNVTNTNQISRPSITDDGRIVIFVNDAKQIVLVEIDWTNLQIVREDIISRNAIWRNAIISRDGTKLAAIRGDLQQGEFDNKIIVFDLIGGTDKEFDLYNPTTSQTNTSVGGVNYADVMEFDHTGENIIYDAFNELQGSFGQDISYWDIGILNVWDNATESFTDGFIQKLFTGLPANITIGNPTFSKNSPNILAFDYRETNTVDDEKSYNVLGLNRETGEVQVIFENNTFGFPSYSIDDQSIIFHVLNNGSDDVLGRQVLEADKITRNGSPSLLVANAQWGVYLGNGNRDLSTAVIDVQDSPLLRIYPNPVDHILYLKMDEALESDGLIRIYNMQGQLQVNHVGMLSEIDISALVSGLYVLEYTTREDRYVHRFIKE